MTLLPPFRHFRRLKSYSVNERPLSYGRSLTAYDFSSRDWGLTKTRIR